MNKYLFALTAALLAAAAPLLHATPSTQIWNPSTDVQAARTFHLGIDNYFSVMNNETPAGRYALATDVGVTYGLAEHLEAGVDYLGPAADPVSFNVKYGLPEGAVMPAVAVGGFGFGTRSDAGDAARPATNANILYGVAARSFGPAGRLSLGYYSGNGGLLVDETGAAANSGLIASWDKAVSEKVWLAVDYASGRSSYGSLSFGGSYAFAANTSVIFGYVIYNNGTLNPNNQFTTQLDINF